MPESIKTVDFKSLQLCRVARVFRAEIESRNSFLKDESPFGLWGVQLANQVPTVLMFFVSSSETIFESEC